MRDILAVLLLLVLGCGPALWGIHKWERERWSG